METCGPTNPSSQMSYLMDARSSGMGVSPDMYGVPSAAVMSVISASLLALPRPLEDDPYCC